MLGICNGFAVKASGGFLVPAPSATIEVRRKDTGALASIFSDEAGTVPITNPSDFTDANGFFTFFAAGIERGYTVTGTDGSLIFTLNNVPTGTFAQVDNPLTTKGDIVVRDGSLPARKAVGANGSIPMARSADTVGIAYVAALNKYIYGWTYANNGADATNDLDIAAGGGMDATGAYWITGAALTKQSDVAWAVGTAAGGLDTGAVGNSDYYIWAIARSDTGVVDYLFSLSSTAPTMPASYDFKRLIGWFKRVGGTIVAFSTYETEGGGIELGWTAPTLDVNLAATLTTSRRTDAVKVPLNFSTIAHINVLTDDAGAQIATWICCPDQADAAPSVSIAPLVNIPQATAAMRYGATALRIRTSATGTIAARSDTATVDQYRVVTLGFTWARRN